MSGAGQYVLVGAGMDTFAFRRPDLRDRVTVFEIDHPATQVFKLRRLADVGLVSPANLRFVAAHLEQETVAAALARAGYATAVPAVFAWLGVTMYLSRDAIQTTLRSIRSAAAASSELVFDYVERDAFSPGRASARVQAMMARVAEMGEPVTTGFEPGALAAELEPAGFRLCENLSPQAIEDRFFAGRLDGLHATEHSWFARASIEL